MKQETFTRKEVRALLKRQIQASANSYEKMPVTEEEKSYLFFGFKVISDVYWDVVKRVKKRLRNVRVIKF